MTGERGMTGDNGMTGEPVANKADVAIRTFEESDYSILPVFHNENFVDRPAVEEDYRATDRDRLERCKFARWMAESGGEIVGTGCYAQLPNKYDPDKYFIWIIVRPRFQRRGIGSKLYETVISALEKMHPQLLHTQTRSDQTGGLALCDKYGLKEYNRGGESHLDPAGFDFSPYAEIEEKVGKLGVKIKTLDQLDNDPDRNRKLWELDWEVTRDEPGSEDDSKSTIEEFEETGLFGPHRIEQGYFVAVHQGEYVGVCMLHKSRGDKTLWHGITGVQRRWRNKGIATALKIRAIRYASSIGCPTIKTGNAEGNDPMLAINRKLGFAKKYDWINLQRRLQ